MSVYNYFIESDAVLNEESNTRIKVSDVSFQHKVLFGLN